MVPRHQQLLLRLQLAPVLRHQRQPRRQPLRRPSFCCGSFFCCRLQAPPPPPAAPQPRGRLRVPQLRQPLASIPRKSVDGHSAPPRPLRKLQGPRCKKALCQQQVNRNSAIVADSAGGQKCVQQEVRIAVKTLIRMSTHGRERKLRCPFRNRGEKYALVIAHHADQRARARHERFRVRAVRAPRSHEGSKEARGRDSVLVCRRG